jgi:hypothetical protein
LAAGPDGGAEMGVLSIFGLRASRLPRFRSFGHKASLCARLIGAVDEDKTPRNPWEARDHETLRASLDIEPSHRQAAGISAIGFF